MGVGVGGESKRPSTPCREACLPEALFTQKKKHISLGAAIWLPAGRCDGGNTLDLIWFVLLVFGDSAIMRDGGAGHQARPLPLSRSSFFPRSCVEPPPPLSSYLFGCAASRLAVLSRALFHCSPSLNCRSIVSSKIELPEGGKKGFVD